MQSALCETLTILKFTLYWLLPHGLKCHFERYKLDGNPPPPQKKGLFPNLILTLIVPRSNCTYFLGQHELFQQGSG